MNGSGEVCLLCGCSSNVSLHHIDGDTRNGDPTNLITLCNCCHGTCHTRYRRDELNARLRSLITTMMIIARPRCLDCETPMGKMGKTWSGRKQVQRYRCPRCGRTYAPTTGSEPITVKEEQR